MVTSMLHRRGRSISDSLELLASYNRTTQKIKQDVNELESCIATKAGVSLFLYVNHGVRRGLCALISNGELD